MASYPSFHCRLAWTRKCCDSRHLHCECERVEAGGVEEVGEREDWSELLCEGERRVGGGGLSCHDATVNW